MHIYLYTTGWSIQGMCPIHYEVIPQKEWHFHWLLSILCFVVFQNDVTQILERLILCFVVFQHCCWPHFLKYISSRTFGSRFLVAPLFHCICSSVHDFPLRPYFTACSVFNKRVHTWQHVLLFPAMHEHPSFRIALIIS